MLDGAGRRVAGRLAHSGGAVLVTQISPDGGQVATIEMITETLAPYPGGHPDPAPDPLPVPRPRRRQRSRHGSRSTAATNWLGGRLLRDDTTDDAPYEQRICVLATNTDFSCERLVAATGHELWDPAVSPDGSLVAVTRAPVDGFSGDDRALLGGHRAARPRRQLGPERLGADVVARRPLDRLRPRRRWAVGRVGDRDAGLGAAHPGLRDPAGVGARRRVAAAEGPEARPRRQARPDPAGRRAGGARAGSSAASAGAGAPSHAHGGRVGDDVQMRLARGRAVLRARPGGQTTVSNRRCRGRWGGRFSGAGALRHQLGAGVWTRPARSSSQLCPSWGLSATRPCRPCRASRPTPHQPPCRDRPAVTIDVVIRAFATAEPLAGDDLHAVGPPRYPRPVAARDAARGEPAPAAKAAERLGLLTVGDLLEHLPRDRQEARTIAELAADETATVVVEVRSITSRSVRRAG